MADAERVSNGKWSKTIQDNNGARDNGYYRGGRRGGGSGGGGGGGGKPGVKIYRPGSGPLRKTGPRDDDNDNSNNNFNENSHSPTRDDGGRSFSGRGSNWRKPSQQLYQPPVVSTSRESTPGPSDMKYVSDKIGQLSTSPSDNHYSDDRRKSKKPEQPIYIPKPRAQALASEQPSDSETSGPPPGKFSGSKGKYDKSENQDGSRNKSEQASKSNRGNMPETFQKNNKPDTHQQGKYDDRRGSGLTENFGSSSSKWDPPPSRMTKSDTWEQPIKGSKNDVWERGRSRDEYGDWRKSGRESGGGKGGRSGQDVGRSKRFPGNKRNNQHNEEGVRWRADSPSNSGHLYRSESISGISPSREIRQTSEPRSLPIDPSRHQRDTRSVEPQQPPLPPLMPPKPPTGRRGRDSKQGIKSNLPPRFQKKAEMAANAVDDWDGSKSLMFQGHAHTLPHSGSRGRGRSRQDDMRNEVGHGAMYSSTSSISSDSRNTRSLTPDQFKRPGTPPSMYRAPSPRGRTPPSHHRNATPPGYPRRSNDGDWGRGGRRTPPPHHRPNSPHNREDLRRAPSQENMPRRHGRPTPPPQHGQRGGHSHQEQGRYRHQSGGNSWEEHDPFYRNRRMSDTRPPVPSQGPRRPSLGAEEQKSSPASDKQGKQSKEQELPRLIIPDIKDWSEEVEETERLQEAEAEAAASGSESGAHSLQHHTSPSERSEHSRHRSGGSSKRRKGRRRGNDGRGGDDRDGSHRSPPRDHGRDVTPERPSAPNSRGSANQISPQQQQQQQQQPPNTGPHKGGLIILPSPSSETSPSPGPQFVPSHMINHPPPNLPHQHQQRVLFDPSNPNKPILVMAGGMRVAHPGHPQFSQFQPPSDMSPHPAATFPSPMQTPFPQAHFVHGYPQGMPMTQPPDMSMPHNAEGMANSRPNWYDHYSESFRASRNPHLLIDIERADWDLSCILNSVGAIPRWPHVSAIRQFLMKSLQTLLVTDIKFCQVENVENHIWRLTFHNVIELLRKGLTNDSNPESSAQHKQTLLAVLEEGVQYFESMLDALQKNFKFSMEELTGPYATPSVQPNNKGTPFTNLAIISAQKICLFLGDLARYKEQTNETANYNKARQWYTKSQMLNPKNGRPYHQLAILALYARRKLDAVYYYMRSLMASNPFHTARESLLSLFDENRKKFEILEKRRRDERAAEEKEQLREKEALGKGLRREIWVHPDGGRQEWRTTADREKSPDIREEELAKMALPEVNRQFVTSYLHVQGKLFTKVGMDTFQDAATQMLREFRALLQHSPVPVSCTRFLQLLALNMFAIENTQLRDQDVDPGYRSALQESALIVSLQMFSIILERCSALFSNPTTPSAGVPALDINEDLQTLLPAVKVWCDWLLCHKAVWNPPPSCSDYSVGPPGNAWSRLAMLVNQLERLDLSAVEFATEQLEGYDLVKLPEDSALAGFTPLMYNIQELVYAKADTELELAQNCLRVKKVQFFGTVFLCGVDPPVLKLKHCDNERSIYVSVVDSLVDSTRAQGDGQDGLGLPETTESGDHRSVIGEDEDAGSSSGCPASSNSSTDQPSEIRNLLNRKEELTRAHQTQERHRQQVQAILEQHAGGVDVEVRPRLLVPDTNCFIDHLAALQQLTHAYTLMVPLVVVNELEGLARGGKAPGVTSTTSEAARHAQHVAECASSALSFLKGRQAGVRCVTTRGTVLASTTCTLEEDSSEQELIKQYWSVQDVKNDDRILTTCLSLIRSSSRSEDTSSDNAARAGERRHVYREVVLITEDRNLRVKALARDVPVRDLPDFIKWANLSR